MSNRLLFLLLAALIPVTASAHGLDHSVETTDAVKITITHTDGTPLSGASYRVTAPDTSQPVRIGTTDARGRLYFVPDRDGDWTVEVWTPDGHGLETMVPWTSAGGTATDGAAAPVMVPFVGVRLLAGVVVAAIAGFLIGRRRPRT
jgi:hypothetical protein